MLGRMYRCEICKKVVPANTPSYLVVMDVRPATYARRLGANRFTKNRKTEPRDDPGGSGFEIVRELRACPDCARRRR
jgi:hypothetical protein